MRRRLAHRLSIWRWRFTLRQGGCGRHGCAGGHGFLRHGIRPRRLPTAYREGRGQEKNCRDTTNRNHSSWNDVALLFILSGMRHPRHKHARKSSARGKMPSDIHERTRPPSTPEEAPHLRRFPLFTTRLKMVARWADGSADSFFGRDFRTLGDSLDDGH